MVPYIGACTVVVLARFRDLLTFGCFPSEDGDIFGVVCMIFLLHVGGFIVVGYITANNMNDLASAQVFQNSVLVSKVIMD